MIIKVNFCKLVLVVFLLVNFYSNSYCQAVGAKFLGKIDFFAIDVLNNSYVLSGNNLCKFTYNQKVVGCKQFSVDAMPLFIDVSNPHKLLVFSQSQQILFFLNNQLAEIAMLRVDRMLQNNYRILNCCVSVMANFWAYDELSDKLLLFDMQLKIVRESNTLVQQIGKMIHPENMAESDNYLIVANRIDGIYIFDLFGNYIYNIPYFSYQNLQISNNMIYCFFTEYYCEWNLKTRMEKQYLLPEKNMSFVYITKGNFSFIDSLGNVVVRKIN